MTGETFNVLEAIQIAKDAEQKAAAFYSKAAKDLAHPIGRKLLGELAEFEQHHYAKLVELENSLREKGAFIAYEGKGMKTRPTSRSEITVEKAPRQAMEVITLALDAEQQAEKRYNELAEKTTDVAAHEMFQKLAEEEHMHYRILRDAYWNLNNRGVWTWQK
jgi:rubrerythrin